MLMLSRAWSSISFIGLWPRCRLRRSVLGPRNVAPLRRRRVVRDLQFRKYVSLHTLQHQTVQSKYLESAGPSNESDIRNTRSNCPADMAPEISSLVNKSSDCEQSKPRSASKLWRDLCSFGKSVLLSCAIGLLLCLVDIVFGLIAISAGFVVSSANLFGIPVGMRTCSRLGHALLEKLTLITNRKRQSVSERISKYFSEKVNH